MIDCPFCSKRLNERFTYCNDCGSKLDGSVVGDFTTDIKYVFRHSDGFIFINSKNGNQVVFREDNMADLERKVKSSGYFWIAKTLTSDRTNPDGNEFLKISKAKNEAPAAQTDNDGGISMEEFRVRLSKRWRELNFIAKPISSPQKSPYDDLERKYGILGVSKEDKENGLWVYKSPDCEIPIKEPTLKRLKYVVDSRGLSWQVIDEALAESSLSEDAKIVRKREEKILRDRKNSSRLDIKEKSRLRKMTSNYSYSNGNSTELDRMFK